MRPTTGLPSASTATGSTRVPTPRTGGDRPDADHAPAGLVGPAWILREITHVPGVLRLAGGRLAFVSTRATLFDRPVAELADLTFRWGFSGAFRVTVGEERLRVHVVRPAGAVSPDPALLDRLLSADGLPATAGDAEAGARWRAALDTGRSRRS